MQALALKHAPKRPWQPQPGEEPGAFVAFLAWAFTEPRLEQLPQAWAELALQHNWHKRALLLDKRLASRPETVEQATAAIAADALIVLRCELEHAAARAMTDPGRARLGDLTQLMRLLAELGAFAGKANGQDSDLNYDSLTAAEMATLAAAGQILAKARATR